MTQIHTKALFTQVSFVKFMTGNKIFEKKTLFLEPTLGLEINKSTYDHTKSGTIQRWFQIKKFIWHEYFSLYLLYLTFEYLFMVSTCIGRQYVIIIKCFIKHKMRLVSFNFRVLRSKFLYIIFSLSAKNLKTILEYQKVNTWIISINISAVYCSHHQYLH